MRIRRALIAGMMAGTLGAPLVLAQTPDNGGHILNLTDVDIKTLIEDVSTITGYTFVIHPDVRAMVTVTSQTPMSTQGVFEVFLSTLRVNGFTAVPAGKDSYRIVPEAIAASDSATRGRGDDTFSTEVYRLEHFSAVEAAKMIQPLLGAQGQVSASPASNNLIVVEYGSNLSRIRSLIRELDQDRAVTRTIPLTSVPAAQMQAILNELNGRDDQGRGRAALSVIAAEASNSIILRGEQETVDRAASLVAQLDTKSGLSRETQVIRLSHTEAVTIEPILRQLAEGVQAEAGPNAGQAASIAVHEPSNSVIISAVPETLASLSQVVIDLDVRRKQVLIEAIIVEVSDEITRELGLQFLVSGENGDVPFASSTFSSAAPNLLALTGALSGGSIGDDLGDGSVNLFQQAAVASLLGLSGGTFGFGGQSGGTLFGVVLNALERDTQSNILSKPSVMALNNQTALVSVGQEIPISSGQVLGDANLNPFQTTERREIGVILNVTPRIGEDNTIRLDIDQEVSSIASAIGTVTTDFILNQSQLQTSIIADDGELIVLGGLIQAQDSIDLDKVPLLGDIPALGRLFQSESKSRSTSNLMVFIRPIIISDRDSAQSATARTYNYIRSQQIIANNGGPASLDEFVGEAFNSSDVPPVPIGENAPPAEEGP